MAWGNGGNGGAGNDKTAGTSITHTLTGDAPAAGEIHLVAVSKDNSSTTDGETSEVTSVTDSGSNTYTKIAEYTNGQGTAATGVTVALFASKIVTGLTAGSSTVTANFSHSPTASAIASGIATCAAGNTFEVEAYAVGAFDGATDVSLTLSSLANQEHLFVYVQGHEGIASDTFTNDADYTAWSNSATSGGSAATNIGVKLGRRIATLTGDTFATTLTNSRDKAAILVALNEVSDTVTGDGALTINVSAAGAGDVLIQGDGAGTVNVSASGSGDVLVQGDGAGTVQVSVAGSGTVSNGPSGDGALTVQISAAGDGAVAVQADGATTIQVSGAGTGDVLVQGDGAGTINISAAATGDVLIQGDGAATIQVAGSGDGSVLVQGDGAGTIQVSAAGDGYHEISGDGAVTIQISASGSGVRVVDVTYNGAWYAQWRRANTPSGKRRPSRKSHW